MYLNIISLSAVCVAIAFTGWEGENHAGNKISRASPHNSEQSAVFPSTTQQGNTELKRDIVAYLESLKQKLREDISNYTAGFVELPVEQALVILQALHHHLVGYLNVIKGVNPRIAILLLAYVPSALYFLVKWNINKAKNSPILKLALSTTRIPTVPRQGRKNQPPGAFYLRSDPRTRQLRVELGQKDAELEVMAKTVKYLQRRSEAQLRNIKLKDTEKEELAKTIEYLQRPSSKKWSDILDRVHQINFPLPQLPVQGTEQVYLHTAIGIDHNETSAALAGSIDLDSDGGGVDNSDSEMEWQDFS